MFMTKITILEDMGAHNVFLGGQRMIVKVLLQRCTSKETMQELLGVHFMGDPLILAS